MSPRGDRDGHTITPWRQGPSQHHLVVAGNGATITWWQQRQTHHHPVEAGTDPCHPVVAGDGPMSPHGDTDGPTITLWHQGRIQHHTVNAGMEPLQPHGGKGQTHGHPMVAEDGTTITPWTQGWTHVTLWIRDGPTATPWTQGRTHVTSPHALHLHSIAGFAPKGHRWLPCPVPAGLSPQEQLPPWGQSPHWADVMR